MVSQLQVLSSYSLLQSTNEINNLVKQARQLGYDALALTDVNVTYGLIEFYKIARKNQLHPILGMTIQVEGLILTDQSYPLLVLAKNIDGYHNLLKLSSLLMTSEQTVSILDKKNLLQNLIVIVPAVDSELATLLEQNEQPLSDYLQKLLQIKSTDLYLGIGLRAKAQDQAYLIQRLAQLHNLPLVALDDVQYLKPEDAFSNEVLHHIAAGTQVEKFIPQGSNYLRSAADFYHDFRVHDLQEAVTNTQKIAQQCQVEIPFQRTLLPHFVTPSHLDSITYLRQLVQQGLEQHFAKGIPTAYQQRVQHELNVINKMGYADYFLIVWDVINQAHKLNIMTGPGRGSAAGSLVSYALGITQVDPLEYGLLFERFLNPERVDMPDIDLDIPDNRREELVQYMQTKYGNDHMAQIITFGTFAAKQSLRDVGRVFGLSQVELSRWSKAIPKTLGISLQSAYQQSLALRNLYQQSARNKLIFKTALKIENLPRHFSTHAAGIVLSAHNLDETVALQAGASDGALLTQQTKTNVEALGLLKIDFLGLRNLTILNSAVQLIQQYFDKNFDFQQVNLNDAATLKLFQHGDTDGVFQFESAGIRSVLRQLQPTNFNDIVATNALYRPGPMQNIDHFIARKHHQEPITYPDESLQPILQPTYGILVYQEQVMQVVSQMAGFSLAEADLLRRAMAKKNEQLIVEKKNEFIIQAVKRGHQKQNALKVYEYIERFANYGFNKSHAVAYSKLAYCLAFIKVHYPQAFFAALLNANLNNDSKITTYLQALKLRQIKVLAPSVNHSQQYFTLEGSQLRFGLSCIKKTRRDVIEDILKKRAQGPYSSLVDLLQRLDARFLKSENLLPLVYSGALDELVENRRQLVQNVADLVESIKLAAGSVSLFDILKPKKRKIVDFSAEEKLDQEKQYLGTYISGHPVERFQHALTNYHFQKITNLSVNASANVLYYIRQIKVIRTKKGTQMAFLSGGDEIGDYTITVFPNLFQRLDLETNQVYVVKIKVTLGRHDDKEYIAQNLELAQNILQKQHTKKLYIRFDTKKKQNLQKLLQLTQQYPGSIPVIVYFEDSDEKFLLKRQNFVSENAELNDKLQELLGKNNFVYQ
ncbi:DNA polymerase III subunit alpha [Bombilactobacillus bombi]|uniref:DNA polymerase III subunit alpha n=1 Tax=Bombilactobacillus bombi TaxID=1303590 RepID=UPI0015E5F361|nr:DNA polymerase III subunit alpha [Bombilactobacillus bombi]MBA1435009.1 DNA polymerase III subunit alpha [Bombilactobacillus bombi]